jgi:hypothetical protein
MEPITFSEVLGRIQSFKDNLPENLREVVSALDAVWIQGQRISKKEDLWEYEKAESQLSGALARLRQQMFLIGDGGRLATAGNLTQDQKRMCEFLYRAFVPTRGTNDPI